MGRLLFNDFIFIFIVMSWFERATFWAGLFGACMFSVPMAWADSLESEDIVMEKMIYSSDRLPVSPSNGVMKIRSSNDAEVFSSGERYFPVMLVETADFKSLDSTFMWRLFNEEGFKDNGVYGSVRDYFIESSGGQFKPTYDIYPIKLPNNFSVYNNDSLFILQKQKRKSRSSYCILRPKKRRWNILPVFTTIITNFGIVQREFIRKTDTGLTIMRLSPRKTRISPFRQVLRMSTCWGRSSMNSAM